ncbi:MAG: A/G-specific adenine glycosylase [Candidatus Aminicenantes bacterium RBG_13_59_9]|nr:MAG: A/G-specific adenine glycosylase [Candidatus Aminicenantes bacterium RBG_13_59_9]
MPGGRLTNRPSARAGFSRTVLEWYRRHHRRLPWRATRDPYGIWISEIMLQQTTVSAVIPHYEKWMEIFPDVRSLARSSAQKVLKAWQGLGYYQRARNLHQTARIVVRDFGGRFPSDHESLSVLPGFGPYTTAAVLSLAFDLPYPVLDANVRRTAMRILAIEDESGRRAEKTVMAFLEDVLPQDNPGLFNQAMMELGSLVCRPTSPFCLLCPVADHCLAFDRGIQETIPPPEKRSWQRIDTVVAVIRDGDKILIQKRPAKGLFAGLWEFPGGKREKGETLERALARELREELGVNLLEARFLLKVSHSYTQFQATLHAYEVWLENQPRLRRDRHRWLTPGRLGHYPFHSGSAKIVRYLEKLEPETAKSGKPRGRQL